MFDKVLIANRGEIAARIIRTLRKMGVSSVAVYSDADKFSAPVLDADHAMHIGASPERESYLNVDAIVEACRRCGAQAVHPGYGFLSENAEFAEKLESQGIRFIGPRSEHLREFGLKHTARELARHSGLQLLPGSELLDNVDAALSEAVRIGYPVMLKSTAGGGGIGMHLCNKPEDLVANFATVQRMATASFGDARVYMERYVKTARHVEVQIFGDGKGRVITLGERDCSLQRRNQKVVEETPAPGLSDAMRQRLHAAARALGEAVSYESAGTVEFIYDVAREDFYFLEVNTRLQVEHPVTESVYNIDLVEWMVRQAAGELQLPEQESVKASGVAVEVRLYAENPLHGFQPSAGLLTEVKFPDSIRIDSWIETGTEVTHYYDPMLAKLIAVGDTRLQAIEKLAKALAKSSVFGIETNLEYLQAVLSDNVFLSGAVATQLLKNLRYLPNVIDVLSPGAQSSIQDDPGRLGYWDVGIPPSGPMDTLNFRLANKAVGNDPGTAALECTMTGPTLHFVNKTLIALTGAAMQATIDGTAQPYYEPITIQAGQTLRLGKIEGHGQRTYLAVRGGIKAPLYLGSRACFALGRFGGHSTSLLRAGDTLHVDDQLMASTPKIIDHSERPTLTSDWSLSVLYGPQGAPDFFTQNDIDMLFSSEYEVFYNSDRTGVRLIGPRPQWARIHGGEAGLHPSNIHDNAYAIGAINFAGDMPIILGPDGPSLGGYVCPAVITRQDMWKLGQLQPGNKLRFVATVDPQQPSSQQDCERGAVIVAEQRDGPVDVVYRRAGDDYLLIEYGPMMLDLVLRLRVHLLMQAVHDANLPAIIDLTPGIRSLQIHYDSGQLKRIQLLSVLQDIEAKLPPAEEVTVPSRIVHLPMAFNDSTIQLAVQKYQNLVRPNAPWCPDNIEFIRRINGLASREEVEHIVFDASYLVLGLGDVYLDAPAATPIDPRHRLVTTKYNPARTWTPENAVGIGGSYMCIYGMESPGGYQLIGRTLQIWNRWKKTAEFDKPYLLHFFDQVRFFPVSEQELDDAREGFLHGCYPLKIEQSQLSFGEYSAFLKREAASIAEFKQCQQAAFEAERANWKACGLDSYVVDDIPACDEDEQLPEGCIAISSHVTGRVWKILVQVGDTMKPDQAVLVLESMKMEIEINAPQSGCIRELRCVVGQTVQSGQTIAILEEATVQVVNDRLDQAVITSP